MGCLYALNAWPLYENIKRLIRIHSASTEFIIYDGGKGDEDGEKV